MGWKGTVRSINSAVKEAERQRQRQQREYERHQQQLAKMAELDRAAAEVKLFEEYIDALVKPHHNDAPDVDWAGLVASSEPEFVEPSDLATMQALQALESYSPSILTSKKKQARERSELEAAVDTAKTADEQRKKDARVHHQQAVEQWKKDRALAERVLAGDRDAWREASVEVDALEADDFLRFVDLDIPDDGTPTVAFGLQSEEVVPSTQKSLLQSGKLSTKNMPKGRFYEIYQDYVCGTLLWVANTVLGLLPIPEVVATGSVFMLNTATGHMEETPIISALIPRATIGNLNLERLDPSDGLGNFNHVMSFKKTKGFEAIEPLSG